MKKSLAVLKHKERIVAVASKEEAYAKGYYSDSMTREEFMQRITKFNPQLRWFENERASGVFDPFKGDVTKGFVCAIGKDKIMPAFTFVVHDRKQDKRLERSDEFGNVRSVEILNLDKNKGKVLARSWRGAMNIIKNLGYEVDDADLL